MNTFLCTFVLLLVLCVMAGCGCVVSCPSVDDRLEYTCIEDVEELEKR